MSCRADLHTHSYASPDGGLALSDYQRALSSGMLDAIAVTDHGTVSAALDIQEHLGGAIIVGEEIKTTEGELIGLYLTAEIAEGMSPEDTIAAIRSQGGLVYVPHPFESVRSGVPRETIARIAGDVDIVETANGRAVFQDKSALAKRAARDYRLAAAASSDAHGRRGWGRTYSVLETTPTRDTLVSLLATAKYREGRVGFGVLYPKLNRLKKAKKGRA